MRLGQQVYFRLDGKLKTGMIIEEIGTDDLILLCEKEKYEVKSWKVQRVPNLK